MTLLTTIEEQARTACGDQHANGAVAGAGAGAGVVGKETAFEWSFTAMATRTSEASRGEQL